MRVCRELAHAVERLAPRRRGARCGSAVPARVARARHAASDSRSVVSAEFAEQGGLVQLDVRCAGARIMGADGEVVPLVALHGLHETTTVTRAVVTKEEGVSRITWAVEEMTGLRRCAREGPGASRGRRQ